MSQPTQPGQDVPDELFTLVAELFGRWYGQDLDFTDEARTLLAAVLPAHEAMVRANLTPQQAADAVGHDWIVTPRTTWSALTADREQIEQEVRAKVAEEARQNDGGPEIVQVCMHEVMLPAFMAWLAERDLRLFPMPRTDDLPTYGVAPGGEW